MDGGLEFTHVLDQEQRLEQADGEFVVEIPLGAGDRALETGLECRADALEHQVEGGQLADFVVFDCARDLLENRQHGALADRAVLALEGAVRGQILDDRLEQVELVRNERVAVDEMLAVLEVAIGGGPVGETQQRLHVAGMLLVELFQCRDGRFLFLEQTSLDDLRDIGAGELQPVLEAVLDFGEIIAFG